MSITIKRPSKPRRPRLPGGRQEAVLPRFRAPETGPVTDEFGFPATTLQDYPREARRLIALAYRELRIPLTAGQTIGTNAEMVCFGLLLDNNVQYIPGQLNGSNNFTFQSYEIGGRHPGGAVVDFLIFLLGEKIACRVQSAFHSLVDPFGRGGQVSHTDTALKLQLEASPFIDRVVDVNRPPARVLETGSADVIQREFQRIRGVMP